MRKQNSTFNTKFISEAGSELKNNDYFGFVELDKYACYVIADGIADLPDAESAKYAIQCVVQAFHEHPAISKRALKSYLNTANKAFLEAPGHIKQKASVTIVVTDYVKMRYAYVGNTRLRLYRGGKRKLESKDMSLSQQLVSQDELQKDLLAQHEERNNLSSYLGQKTGFSPNISKKFKLMNTDIIALYTRGIWENLDSGELDDLFEEAQDDPQKTLDDIEDALLSKQPKHLENYTVAAIFIDKVFNDPNRRRHIKRILIICLIVLLVAAVITLVVWLVLRDRARKTEDMNFYLSSMTDYIGDGNYVKAQADADKAHTLAGKLHDKEKKGEIDAYIKLIDSILNADGLLSEGKYEEAQQAYLAALERCKYADNLGQAYIEKNLQKALNYTEIYDLIADGDLLYEQGNFNAAEKKYSEAKKLAAGLYHADGKKAAQEGLEQVYAAVSEEAKADKEAQKEAAQKTSEASQTAADLISKGDKALEEGDIDAAITAYTMAKQKLEEIGDDTGVADIGQKLALANKQKQDNDMLKNVAEKYTAAGEQALADGDPEKAQEYYDKAKDIYAGLGLDKMADMMENKLEMDDPEAAQAMAQDKSTSGSASGKASSSKGSSGSGILNGSGGLTVEERQQLLSEAQALKKKGDRAFDNEEYMKAKRYYREARDLYEELGMDRMAEQMEDLMDDADEAYDKGVNSDVDDLKGRYAQAQNLEDQADIERWAGRYEEAISLYMQARAIYIELGLFDQASNVQQKVDEVRKEMGTSSSSDAGGSSSQQSARTTR